MGKEDILPPLEDSQIKLDPYEGTYNAYWETASSYKAAIPPHFKKFTRRLANNSSIIEFGCGTGEISDNLQKRKKRNYRVIATDINPAMISEVQLRHSNLTAKVIDMRDTSTLGTEADGVVAAYSFIHISPQEAPQTMQGICSVLKPGGVAYFAMQGIRDKPMDQGWFQHPKETMPVYIYLYSPEYMNTLFENAGFSVLIHETVEATPEEFQFPKDIYIVQREK